jgi:hypothetical protein
MGVVLGEGWGWGWGRCNGCEQGRACLAGVGVGVGVVLVQPPPLPAPRHPIERASVRFAQLKGGMNNPP